MLQLFSFLLVKSKQEISSSEMVWRFHEVMRLLLAFCFIPLDFHPQGHLVIQGHYWSPCHYIHMTEKNWRERWRKCTTSFLKSLPRNPIWHIYLYFICQNLVHGHKKQSSLAKGLLSKHAAQVSLTKDAGIMNIGEELPPMLFAMCK